MKHNKRIMSVRIDSELFENGTYIIQNVLRTTYTNFIENKLKELIQEHRQ